MFKEEIFEKMKKIIEERPWGKFEQFTLNEISTVKIITVKPNSKLSLQRHFQREEFWRVIEGECEIIIDKELFKGKKNDEFFIPIKTEHRLIGLEKQAKILEISFGKFNEMDIERIEDEYKRK